MSKSEIEAKIEFIEVIGEAKPGDYQPIRFTRIKYKASHQTHIDIRKFQRGYDDDGNDVFFPTKYGFRFLESEFNRVIKKLHTFTSNLCSSKNHREKFCVTRKWSI
jgi:hypothetical protein